jgi:hypothetical protein
MTRKVRRRETHKRKLMRDMWRRKMMWMSRNRIMTTRKMLRSMSVELGCMC